MEKIAELKKDVAEMEALIAAATRQKVKDFLSIENRKLVTEIVKLEEQQKTATPAATDAAKSSAVKRHYQVKLNNYAWDQSNKFVKFYVTVKNVHSIPAENVSCTFTAKSLEMQVKDLDNKDYIMNINNLLYPVNPENSTWKIKTDTVVINVAKVDTLSWSHVTDIEKRASDAKKMPKAEEGGDPSDNMMSIMKKFYDQGDDEVKRNIAKAWTEAQEKKTTMPL
ncbi:PREDICTED: calcyclin-binding protein [Nicrophorus vespilloides]|uniref:Calcyclin-binding protein n=1 Tax=Nicrophorus vespilloides TaxID=110193 RepID=A0ABM1N4U7_NICVS|nr:PREDICTED: calcyclin-binding protein [Nicrophorus vespilloides]XP_017781846.1 PREDICTED: calcyclin-binding protein [Nicrophorus vespilloides]XP_017781847.1 PREDICTED: calcyclin-binding protein [Nicrophorus vespilloides]